MNERGGNDGNAIQHAHPKNNISFTRLFMLLALWLFYFNAVDITIQLADKSMRFSNCLFLCSNNLINSHHNSYECWNTIALVEHNLFKM